jgi:hypothetical protein
MHLLAISLLALLAGTLLLAKTRKEELGKFFAFISWFFIVVGFLLFIGFLGGGICRLVHHGFIGKPNCQQEMMMKGCDHGMQGGICCPEGMDKGMCSPKPGCMSHDSMMKCCSKKMAGDSTKIPAPKE